VPSFRVGAIVVFDVGEAASVVLQVAAQGQPAGLHAEGATGPVPAEQLPTGYGSHGHLVTAQAGTLSVSYTATVTLADSAVPASTVDKFRALLPSRYCPSDRMTGFAVDQFGTVPPEGRPAAIRDYVHNHLAYITASSTPTTDAIDTLLSGQGVCRDYAHLMVTLCRGANVPARVVSVYAPGLSPMDFHLVVETAAGNTWQVWDPTGLAPRQSLVRIATGRDAADVAFSTVLQGSAALREIAVTATVDGDLPVDTHTGPQTLPSPG
jgi:transglutaminase-like putative cysteine protease